MTKYLAEIILTIAEVLIAACGFSPVRNLFFGTPAEAVSAVVPTQLAAFAIYLAWQRHHLDQSFAQLQTSINGLIAVKNEARALQPDEFYSLFRHSVETARRQVAISHLDDRRPNLVPNSIGDSYFAALPRLINNNQKLTFRRIERVTHAKIEWIEDLIQRYKGRTNFSLACLEISNTERHIPYISMQVIDEDSAFLVAVGAQSDHPKLRDIYVRDPLCARVCLEYYNTHLWNKAAVIIDCGQVNYAKWSELRNRVAP